MNVLSLEAKNSFIHLQKFFTKASILHHFKLKHYIHNKTDVFGFCIGMAFSQLTLDQSSSGQIIHKHLDSSKSHKISYWHLMVFFSIKIIFVKSWYETYDLEFLAIIEMIKT